MRSTIFSIFEGTSEIQRLIIGRAVAGLDVRFRAPIPRLPACRPAVQPSASLSPCLPL